MLTSGFFNDEKIGVDENGVLYDRTYKAEFFSKYFSSFISNGVFGGDSESFQVVGDNGLNIRVKSGKAFIMGYFCYSDEDEIITLSQSDGLEDRIDRIVLQLNLQNREIALKVLEGDTATPPKPKEITRNGNIFELALCDVFVKSATDNINTSDITDLRLNSALCGLVTHLLNDIDTTTLYNQIQADLKEFKNVEETNFINWFNGIKNLLNENAIEKHIEKTILDSDGVHGFRYNESINNFEGYKENEDKWVSLKGLGVGEVTLPDIPYKKIKATKQGINIFWSDPPNAIINNNQVKEWYGTILIKKIGSPPLSYDDGEILIDNIIKDKYKDNPYIDTNIEIGQEYYYGLFSYDQNGVYNTSFANIMHTTGTSLESLTYSFILDLDESNPDNNITYADDAEEYTTPESWDDSFLFNAIKPCVLKDGQVNYYLDPNNYDLKEDGTPSDLTGSDGDVMVEFPPLFYKVETIENRKLKFLIRADYEDLVNNEEWCKAHLNYIDKLKYGKKLYHSVYIATTNNNNNNTVLSVATNQKVFIQERITNLINRVKAKGANVFLTGIFDFNLLTILCFLRFKTTNLQKIFNLEKFVNITTQNKIEYTIGSLKTGGLFSGCGSDSPQEAIKICGIEFFCNGYVKNNDIKTPGLMANIQCDVYGGKKFIYYISRPKMLELGAGVYRSNTDDHLYYTDNASWGYINDFEFSPDAGIIPKITTEQPNSTNNTYLTVITANTPNKCTPIYYNLFAKNDNGFNMIPSRNNLEYTDQNYSTYFVYIPSNEDINNN